MEDNYRNMDTHMIPEETSDMPELMNSGSTGRALNPPSPKSDKVTLQQFEDLIKNGLIHLGFPYEKLVADRDKRLQILANLDSLVKNLPQEKRETANYISKYTIAVAAGLFDAALNYIWNAAVVNLRSKAESGDLQYFFEQLPSGRKGDFKTTDDLSKVIDSDLIDVSEKLGFISKTGAEKLHYIRNLRNRVSAAHPTDEDINEFELMSNLSVILEETVCQKVDSASINVNKILSKVRDSEIRSENIPFIKKQISSLPKQRVDTLGRGLFGIYVDPTSNAISRNNITKLFPQIWTSSSTVFKERCGALVGEYVIKMESEREENARNLIELVRGGAYLPSAIREKELQEAINQLEAARTGYDNFYNEPPAAKKLESLIQGVKIPKNVRTSYLETLLRAYLGNGNGNSDGAQEVYDRMLSMLDNKLASEALMFLTGEEFANSLYASSQQKQFNQLIPRLEGMVLYSEAKELLSEIQRSKAKPSKLYLESTIKRWRNALGELIEWQNA